MSDLLMTSLRNRIRAMNSLWERAVSDMTLEQVNHHERSGVLPIAFSLSHCIRGQDSSISRYFLGEATLWESEGWAKRVGVTVDKFGREEGVEEMEQLRFADFSAWKEYQSAVISRMNRVVETLTEEMLAEEVMPALPPNMQHSYMSIVVGPGNPVRKLDILECFIYQHGLRHMGEIEHSRALVGLRGMTS